MFLFFVRALKLDDILKEKNSRGGKKKRSEEAAKEDPAVQTPCLLLSSLLYAPFTMLKTPLNQLSKGKSILLYNLVIFLHLISTSTRFGVDYELNA